MARISDQEYLLTQQYGDAANLRARIELHRRFSTNPIGWHVWAFDQLRLPEEGRVLELGCGSGDLWWRNRDRLPAPLAIILSDLSPGMLREARDHLGPMPRPLSFAVIDAEKLPFGESEFDLVIANHMLYHLPDLHAALGEIRRVLRPGGRLVAATIGNSHMHELRVLLRRVSPSADPGNDARAESFLLENGCDVLSGWFEKITLLLYEDSLVITEVEPLVAYARSMLAGPGLTPAALSKLTAIVEQRIGEEDALHVTKASGLFEAVRGARPVDRP